MLRLYLQNVDWFIVSGCDTECFLEWCMFLFGVVFFGAICIWKEKMYITACLLKKNKMVSFYDVKF